MKQGSLSTEIEGILYQLHLLRSAYDLAKNSAEDERVVACFEIFGRQKQIQSFELAKAFHRKESYQRLVNCDEILTKAERLISRASNASEFRMAMKRLVDLEEDVRDALGVMVGECQEEVKRFILCEHRKDIRRQIRALREVMS